MGRGHNSFPMSHSRSRSYESSSSSSSSSDPPHFVWYPGQLINDRYRVRKLLGDGTFGRVLQVEDTQQFDQVYALKVIRPVSRYVSSAKYEAEILEFLAKSKAFNESHVVKLVEHFDYGDHYCLVYELLGPTLYDVVRANHYKGPVHPGFPIHQVQHIAKQLLESVDFLHLQRVVHTDLKLENVSLTSSEMVPTVHHLVFPAQSSIKLIDFGGAVHYDEDRSSVINTRQYRAPEVILGEGYTGMSWNEKSDIWSLACVLSELYTGDLLFPTHDNYEHLAMIERMCGRIPLHMASESHTAYFDHRLRFNFPKHASEKQIRAVKKLPLLEVRATQDLVASKHREFRYLLSDMLEIDPARRPKAYQLLRHPFFERVYE